MQAVDGVDDGAAMLCGTDWVSKDLPIVKTVLLSGKYSLLAFHLRHCSLCVEDTPFPARSGEISHGFLIDI